MHQTIGEQRCFAQCFTQLLQLITMTNKHLNEAESLELITSMIQDTRARLARNSGTPFLIWGYTTVAIALLNSITTYLELSYYWNFSWFAIPIIGWIGMMLFNKKENGARNIIDRVIAIVWGVLGVSFIWIYIGALIYDNSILYYSVFIMGIGTLITGLVIRHKTTQYCGIGALICALAFPLVNFVLLKNDLVTIPELRSWVWVEIAYFAVIFFFMMVVPGHILNHKYNRNE